MPRKCFTFPGSTVNRVWDPRMNGLNLIIRHHRQSGRAPCSALAMARHGMSRVRQPAEQSMLENVCIIGEHAERQSCKVLFCIAGQPIVLLVYGHRRFWRLYVSGTHLCDNSQTLVYCRMDDAKILANRMGSGMRPCMVMRFRRCLVSCMVHPDTCTSNVWPVCRCTVCLSGSAL